MGWGIDFNAEIYLSHQDYKENPYLVKDEIREIEENLSIIKAKLKMFASANIKEIVPQEWINEPIDWVNSQLEDLINYYDELFDKKIKLELYLDYLDNKNLPEKSEDRNEDESVEEIENQFDSDEPMKIYTEPLTDEQREENRESSLLAPVYYHLIDCLKDLKFGRPVNNKTKLQEWIDYLYQNPEEGRPFS